MNSADIVILWVVAGLFGVGLMPRDLYTLHGQTRSYWLLSFVALVVCCAAVGPVAVAMAISLRWVDRSQ